MNRAPGLGPINEIILKISQNLDKILKSLKIPQIFLKMSSYQNSLENFSEFCQIFFLGGFKILRFLVGNFLRFFVSWNFSDFRFFLIRLNPLVFHQEPSHSDEIIWKYCFQNSVNVFTCMQEVARSWPWMNLPSLWDHWIW